jgi:hypothetical protein
LLVAKTIFFFSSKDLSFGELFSTTVVLADLLSCGAAPTAGAGKINNILSIGNIYPISNICPIGNI